MTNQISSEPREQKFSRMLDLIKTGKVDRINSNELRISPDFTIKLISGRDGDDVVCVIDGQHHTGMFDEEEVSRIHDADNWFKAVRREQEKKDLFMSRGF